MLKEKLIEYLEQEDVKGAFAVKDLRSGEICTFNENEVVPSASLIKMFILIKTIDLIREGRLSLTDEIEVKAGDIVAFSVLEFLAPRKYMLEELLRRVGCVADGRTRGQWHLPSELHDRGDDASENTCECCDAILAALGIGLNECHVTSMKAAS